MKNKNQQNKKTGDNDLLASLVVYNIGCLGMFLFFVSKIQNYTLIGVVLFMTNLVLPVISSIKEQFWGKYALSEKQQLFNLILKGVKYPKFSSLIEKGFSFSFFFWLLFSLITIIYGALI